MTNFMKRAADAVVDKLLELMQRDRAAQEAKPKSAESPLIVIPIPKWRTYFALAFITVFFLGLVCRAVWLQAVTTDFLQDQGEARYARTLTIVGERGVTLSGGQKQRAAIARMLTQRAPIMVFDDSLSAVDAETDLKIRTQLKNNLGKSTVVLISHRVTTLMSADCILVLDKGEVKQIGTHEELMAQDGIYRSIFEMQMSTNEVSA